MSRHEMPFGAALLGDGQARFRLWAPGQSEVGLVLPGRGERRSMRRLEGGWHELTTEAAAGEPYQLALQDGLEVADPASRCQAEDAIGPSLVVDPLAYQWRETAWRGRPWHETVLYELHVGTFTPEGTYAAAAERLPQLAELGITAIELMPLADFPGRRNWGYDGVLLYAPDRAYGTPDELKALIDRAHALGLMVFLDVVYNHFGPEGNYLNAYAPDFFTEDFKTPWGSAIDFRERAVRDFYVHNALYWLEEYRFDGLRFDAVHAIVDPDETHILQEIARAVRRRFAGRRQAHLVLENEKNQARFLRHDGEAGQRLYDAQWNDDLHHVLHVLLTGETNGYYEDFAPKAASKLARGLKEGFVYQGEPSRHQKGKARGEASADLPPLAFVDFIQNHDQIGNRALGERLAQLAPPRAVQAAQAVLLLSPHVPMLFMGEEWGSRTPFMYFCDFHGELGQAVSKGRKKEFAAFFADLDEVPDPLAESTFAGSKLDWDDCGKDEHASWLEHTRRLLHLRATELMPRLAAGESRTEAAESLGAHGVRAVWRLGDGSRLTLLANLGPTVLPLDAPPDGRLLYAHGGLAGSSLSLWSVLAFLD